MIISKCVDIKSVTASDAMGEYFFTVFNDAAATLRINNQPVMQVEPNVCDLTFNAVYNFTGNGGSGKSGKHVSFFQFINDFASLDCGIMHNDEFATLGRYNSANVTSTQFNLYNLNTSSIGESCSTYLYPAYDKSPRSLRATPYYLYNGADIAYVGLGHMDQCIVFAKLKSTDDPTIFKYVVIVVAENSYAISSDYAYRGMYDSMKIITNSSLQTITYSGYINRKLDNINKSVIEKFIIDGFYSNELFLFDGLCPCGLFNLNNNTYLNLGYNLYMKITN